MSKANNNSLPHLSKSSDIELTELESVFIQNLYSAYANASIEKEFRGGFSGTRVFLVLPIRSNGARDARKVAKIGPVDELRQEKENFDKNVKPILPFTGAGIGAYIEKDDLAAMSYDFAGGEELDVRHTTFHGLCKDAGVVEHGEERG